MLDLCKYLGGSVFSANPFSLGFFSSFPKCSGNYSTLMPLLQSDVLTTGLRVLRNCTEADTFKLYLTYHFG